MKKLIYLIFLILIINGCATVLEGMPGFVHTAALTVGEERNKVLSQAKHILIRPKQVDYAFKGTPNEIEIRRYTFTVVYDLALYFHNNIFFQASLVEPEIESYPKPREDYKDVGKYSQGPVAYLLIRDGDTFTIKTLNK